MFISVNLLQAAAFLAGWLLLRYSYQCFVRWNCGHPTPFDPLAGLEDIGLSASERRHYYLKGKASIIIEYGLEDQCSDEEIRSYLDRIGHRSRTTRSDQGNRATGT